MTTQVHPKVQAARSRVEEAVGAIRGRCAVQPRIGVILGSGLGSLGDEVEGGAAIHYGDLPHFPVSTAPGHAGRLVLGELEGKAVITMQGRLHTYEGYSAQDVSFPVRVMKALGVETLVVTCATGGLNPHFVAGDLMVIRDHLNFTGDNPLIGPNDPELGPRFPVMFDCYRPELRKLAHEVALGQGLRLQEGVYAGITGPVYFTRAELRHLQWAGADAIGMSTVHEVIAATHAGMRALGIGVISDMAIPDAAHHATEEEILQVAAETGPRFVKLLRGIVAAL